MKRIALLFTLVFWVVDATSQNIVIEEVPIVETIEKKNTSRLPRFKDLSNRSNPMVSKLNAFVLDVFSLETYNQNEITEFRWYDVKFVSEVKGGIAFIRYEGEYYGAYPTNVTEELFFDLATGERLPNQDVPFHALFSLDGYFKFLNRHWLANAKEAFKKATTCAEAEPECSYYDIDTYELKKGLFRCALQSECYPHVSMACSPDVQVSIPIDSLKPFLTTRSTKMLVDERYSDKKGIDKFLFNKKVRNELPNHLFVFGRINDKYPFSMALKIDKAGTVQGFYYYDSKKQNLTVTGIKKENKMQLAETVNNKKTGQFDFEWSATYQEDALAIFDNAGASTYLRASWSSADGTKKYKVTITEAKASDRK
jgi:hypothetical protein